MDEKEDNKEKPKARVRLQRVDKKGETMPKVIPPTKKEKKSKPDSKKPVTKRRKARPRRGKAKNIELAEKICNKYAEGTNTIEGVCENYSVKYATFHSWITEGRKGYIQEVQALYKKAIEQCDANYDTELKNKAKESLLKKVSYVEIEETHTETKVGSDGKPISSSIKKVKKTLVPTDSAIIFSLTNKDPKNFQNSHSIKGELEVTIKDKWENATVEELEAEEKRLKGIIAKANKK